MNKRFKGSQFDERIIGYGKDIIDPGNEIFQVDIRAVGEYADAIILRRDHKDNRPEASVGTSMVNGFWGTGRLLNKPAISIPQVIQGINTGLSLPCLVYGWASGKNAGFQCLTPFQIIVH